MALQLASSTIRNQAATILDWSEDTGVYNATTRPGGFGVPNPTIASNVFTRFDFILPDLSTARVDVDAATIPTTNFVPKNALTRQFTLADLGLTSDEFATGLIQVTYKPYFSTASGGNLTFTNSTNVVVRASGQDLTVDYANSSMVLFNCIEYTIVPGSLAVGQFLISAVYTGATLTLPGYIGYSHTSAAIIDKEFQECLMPKYVQNRTGTCDKSLYSTISKLYFQWQAMYALHAIPDFAAANTFLQDITRDCTCLSSTSATGCSTCL